MKEYQDFKKRLEEKFNIAKIDPLTECGKAFNSGLSTMKNYALSVFLEMEIKDHPLVDQPEADQPEAEQKEAEDHE